MATVLVKTVVQEVTVSLSIPEARALVEFFGTLDPTTAPNVVKDISRRFRKAVVAEVFETPVD